MAHLSKIIVESTNYTCAINYGHPLILFVKIINFVNRDTNQFRIARPGGVIGFLFPELVLLVNTLAFYVIECKGFYCF